MARYLFCLDAGIFADGDGTGSNLLSDVGRTLQRVCFKSCWLIRPRSNIGRRVSFEYSPLMQYCSRYIVGTPGKGEVNTGTTHLGFRCVRSASQGLQPIAIKPKN
jgi:hypothetical protein